MNNKDRFSGKVVIFGVGKRFKDCLRILNYHGYKVLFAIDNSDNSVGSNVLGYDVYSPSILYEIKDCLIVISGIKYEKDIRQQLRDMGIDEDRVVNYTELEGKDAIELLSKRKKHISPSGLACRVLYDHTIFGLQNVGGISRYFAEIANRISVFENFDVSWCAGINNNIYCSQTSSDMDYFSYNGLCPSDKILQEFTKEHEYDVHHLTYYTDYSFVRSKKKVITIYDMIHELFYPNSPIVEQKRKMIGLADGIITISDYTKRDLQELYDVYDEKIRVIYLGNSLKRLHNRQKPLEDSYILFVGKRDGYKNFNTFLRAFSKSQYSKEIKLLCFGGGDFSAEEKELINVLGMTDRVIQMSGDDDLLANVYANAEAFAFPSKHEGFGIPLLEAMHLGTPIICSRTSSFPEVAGEAALFFDPDQIDDIATSIDKVLEDNSLRRHLVETGFKREKEFSWERCARETCDYYSHIIGRD